MQNALPALSKQGYPKQPGNHRCRLCIEITKETLAACAACDGLLHRVGIEEICDSGNHKGSTSLFSGR
jgi:hypothetical protein